MTGIVIKEFAGVAPRYNAKQLGAEMATVCNNVDLDAATLRPMTGPNAGSAVTVAADTVSVHNINGVWKYADHYRQYVHNILANDILQRTQCTDEDYPRIFSYLAPTDEWSLGIPRPATPSATIIVAGAAPNRDQAYVVTYVDGWGREGPPSAVSNAVTVGVGSNVQINLPAVHPDSRYNLTAASGAQFRIYRTNTGTTGTLFQYVGTIATNFAIYNDLLEPAALQEALITQDWIGPPDDDAGAYPSGPLASLVELPGGILAGHSGNAVYFSEPYVSHAWPLAYRISRSSPIQAIAPVAGGLFVATWERPYLIAGSTPGSMVAIDIESEQPCVAQRSMVDMGDYCIYASAEGLVMGQGNTAKLITEDHLTAAEWWAYFSPLTIRASKVGGKYIAFFGDIDDGTGFIFDPRHTKKGLRTLTDHPINGLYHDPTLQFLYGIVKDGSSWERQWLVAGSTLSMTWQSKAFSFPHELNLVCGRVEAEAYPVTLTGFVDGVQKFSFEVPDAVTFRLPRGFKGRRFQFGVSGTNEVVQIGFWDNMSEVS